MNDILVHFFQETWKQGIEQDSYWASEYQHDAVRNIHYGEIVHGFRQTILQNITKYHTHSETAIPGDMT